ncbi:thioesterase family protein [Gordonia sp. ABSL1-1]|uniref:acyl-CoA thioesterase n=1 Tax=Gordonia sp. ABSL1-1 TaxID=3053923 RepID=UPI002572AA27|nr:thioesterase family protein [Gordonia sp. ABSL1-1]MDL9937274.1 thioesterase family protein [Gordonia sp. ABSL1-1]
MANDYRLDVELHLRWGDMDINNHINNVQFARLFEEARVRCFRTWRSDHPWGVAMLVARQDIEFAAPLHYTTEPIVARACVSRVGRSSFAMAMRLIDPAGTVCASAETTMVVTDKTTGRPMEIPAEMRTLLTERLGEPISFHAPRPVTAG